MDFTGLTTNTNADGDASPKPTNTNAHDSLPPPCPHTKTHIELTSVVCDRCTAVVGHTNTSLREEILSLLYANGASNYTADKIEALLTAKTSVADNISLVANATLPAEWMDPVTGKRLYNEMAVAAKTEAAIKRNESLCGCPMCNYHAEAYQLVQLLQPNKEKS